MYNPDRKLIDWYFLQHDAITSTVTLLQCSGGARPANDAVHIRCNRLALRESGADVMALT
jgi:hypothetical protein